MPKFSFWLPRQTYRLVSQTRLSMTSTRFVKRAKETPLTSVTLGRHQDGEALGTLSGKYPIPGVVRWGDAKKALASQGKEIPNYSSKGVSWDFSNPTSAFHDKHMLLPIPLKESELNPNIQQNTGW